MSVEARLSAPFGQKKLQRDVNANYRMLLPVIIAWFIPVWILVAGFYHSSFSGLLFVVAALVYFWGREVIKFLFGYVEPKAVDLNTFFSLHREFWQKYTRGLIASVILYSWGFWFGSIVLILVALKVKRDLTIPLAVEFEAGTRPVPADWLAEEYNEARPAGDAGFYFAGVRPPHHEVNTHQLYCGTNGSGKTNLLRLYMQSVLCRCGQGKTDRALIHDAKSEFVPILVGMGVSPSDIKILNIFDSRANAWDMALDLTRGRDGVALAHNLLPEKEGNAGNSEFFDKAARRVLSGVTRLFQRYAPGAWTLRDLVLASQSMELITLLLSQDKQLRRNLSVLGAGDTTGNVMASIGAAIGDELETVAAYHYYHYRAGRTFTLKDWYQNNAVLMLGCDTESEATLRPYNQLLFTRAAQMLTTPNNSGGYTYFILDELPVLGKLEKIEQVARLGRSYLGSLCIAFQAYSDLEHIYGDKLANSLIGQCDKAAYLRARDEQTARWASTQIGQMKKTWKAQTRGTSKTTGQIPFSGNSSESESYGEQRETEPAVRVESIMNTPKPDKKLGRGVAGYFRADQYVFENEVTSAYLTEYLKPAADTVAGFEPLPEMAEDLPLWDEDDIERLGIGHFLAALSDKDLGALPIEDWVNLRGSALGLPEVELSSENEGIEGEI